MNRKKITKIVNELYDYSKTLDVMPPRGEGAKLAVAQEIHGVMMKLFTIYDNEELSEKKRIATQQTIGLMLMELCEQILIDKVDTDLSVQMLMMLEEE